MLFDKCSALFGRLLELWRKEGLYTIMVVPEDGAEIKRKQLDYRILKFAVAGAAAFSITLTAVIGGLSYYVYHAECERQEMLAYRREKAEQEERIRHLAAATENMQKDLATLSKLEDSIRAQMGKTGMELPPKTDVSVYAGTGGPLPVSVPKLDVLAEQDKNISGSLKAKIKDWQQLLAAIKSENYRREVTPDFWPVGGGSISSSFGSRSNPFDYTSHDWHPGIDIAADYGTPVYAGASGTVEYADWYGGYGKYIKIIHDYGYSTAYGHMSSLATTAGSYVEKGELIGYVGSTGYSTGPHLHYEVMLHGEQVDPMQLIK